MKKEKKWFVYYYIGIILGAIIANIAIGLCEESVRKFFDVVNAKSNNDEVINEVTWKIFCSRIREMVIIFIFSITIAWDKIIGLFLVYKGVVFAIAESVMIFLWGKYGVLKYVFMTVKYYPVYILSIIFILVFLDDFNKRIMHRCKENLTENIIRYVLFFSFSIGLLFVESILESNGNRYFFL